MLELRTSSSRKARPTGGADTRDALVTHDIKLQRILVATDFSVGALEALEFASGLAKRFQSKIFLVHTIPSGVLRYVAPAGLEDAIQQAKNFASEEMQRLVNKTGCANLVQPEILCGEGVWPMLQQFAAAQDIDLIVLGTHGQTAAKKRLLGPWRKKFFGWPCAQC